MKLRIQGDSIRLRLTVGEVAAIGAGTVVRATTAFPSGAPFGYRLEPSASASNVTAAFEDRSIVVRMPASLGERWATDPDHISIHGAAGPTKILIEKDFACLDPREDDDQSELFANPGAVS